MDLILEVINKYTDKILLQFGNIFQCLGLCWVSDIGGILIVDGEKVLNMFTVILD